MTSQPDQARGDIAHHLHPFTNLASHEQRGPLIIERGEGIYLYDTTGKRYLDAMSSLWCCALGYSERRLVEAATRQLDTLPYSHTFRGRSNPPVIELAERLLAMTAPALVQPMAKVFFANSGSEANETAIKLAWYYHHARGKPQKRKIITRTNAYHGSTIVAAAISGLPAMHSGFNYASDEILVSGCPHYYRYARDGESDEQFGLRLAHELEALIAAEGADTIAAFIAEPVMGVGGVIVPPANYFAAIERVLRRHDILLIADEVICAFGRTGNLLGSQTVQMCPDILTTAKALSSAYQPISAVLVSAAVFGAVREESDRQGVFSHGLTYSGHPVAAAVALEALRIYDERNVVAHVREVGSYLEAKLRTYSDHPLIGEVRGVGLMRAIELVADKDTKRPFDSARAVGAGLMDKAESHGLFVRAVGDTVILAPPLVIEPHEVDALVDGLDKALADMPDLS